MIAKMVSVDELKQRFGPALVVAPYGECIVIQGSEFDPDWEAELGDKGYTCHFTDLDGHAVTLVQLKKAVAEGKVVYVPPAVPRIVHGNGEVKEVEKKVENEENKRVNWQPEEDALLISLWNQGSSVPDIAVKVEEKYPSRKGNSVNMRLKRLRIVGQIQPRNKHVRSNVAKEASNEGEKVENVTEKQNSGNPRPIMPWLKDAKLWSPEEDALIVELWKKGLTLAEIGVEVNKKYPKRVRYAVSGRVYQLQGKGSIEKRHKPKLKAAKAPETTDAEKSEKSEKSIEEVEVKVAFPEELLKTIEDLNRKAVVIDRLSQAYDSLCSAIVELKTKLNEQARLIQEILLANQCIEESFDELRRDLIRHKHAVSGEAMPPWEA